MTIDAGAPSSRSGAQRDNRRSRRVVWGIRLKAYRDRDTRLPPAYQVGACFGSFGGVFRTMASWGAGSDL